VFGLKFDDGVSRFRLVSSQVGRIGVAAIRKIYNPRYLSSPPSRFGGRLHNVQSLAVEKESVIAEQFVQRGNAGWLSGMASASNWLRVRSICAEVNFIAHSYRGFALDIMRCTSFTAR
jgi:hypothetical protein